MITSNLSLAILYLMIHLKKKSQLNDSQTKLFVEFKKNVLKFSKSSKRKVPKLIRFVFHINISIY